MKKFLFYLKSKSLRFSKSFDNKKHSKEPGFFGLGQFVLLLCIAPFIFNLELYSIGEIEKVPSLYEYDFDRFESLPALPDAGNQPKPPKEPKFSIQKNDTLNSCKTIARLFYPPNLCKSLANEKRQVAKAKARFHKVTLPKYLKDQKNYIQLVAEEKNALAAYDNFKPELTSKPSPLPEIIIKETSTRSFTAMLESNIAIEGWQETGKLIWLLSILLIVPAIYLCIRKKCWSLLACGLAIPAVNYLFSLLSLIPSLNNIINWQMNISLVAQIAFIWFAIKGHILSKSFAMFILVLSISVSWAALVGGENFSIFKAQLPILVFIVAAIIARLLVKGVQENAYLFIGKGIRNNLLKAGHAFILWLPLAFLALPLLYLTSVTIPKSMVTQLHNDKVLQFGYEHDILDNALQSVAKKTDDAFFAWHLSTESTKRDIYREGTDLLNQDLQRRVEVMFDQIMPVQLDFERHESDKFIIGEGIELAVDAAQDSTNDAFKNMRRKMKLSLSNLAATHEKQFDSALKKGVIEALGVVDQLHQEGVDLLLESNRKAQNTLWWSINYTKAVHTLTVLLFIFICLKSFLYVFARVSFNRNTGTFITLGNTGDEVVNEKSHITATGLQYLIQAEEEETFFISRKFQCRGKAPNYSIPQFFRAPFARLFNGAYSMNKVAMQKGDDAVTCTATQGIEFFEWELKADEIVLFDFYNFVGISESIQISTHISTRASSLLLGKMIYSQAMGPGKLILMAKGRAEITDSELQSGSLPPERIIATQKNTRFHIDSELDLVNIYLSTAYVRPAGGGQVIVDVDSQRGTKTGLGSFIKRFLLPL